MNARLRALSHIAHCLYRLDEPNAPAPGQSNALVVDVMRMTARVVFFAVLLLAWLVGASLSALAGLGLAALVLDALGGAAWRRHQAAQIARPDSWEGLLREALRAWPTADFGMRAQLDSWAQQTPLPLTELKQWLAQERAVTPPM